MINQHYEELLKIQSSDNPSKAISKSDMKKKKRNLLERVRLLQF